MKRSASFQSIGVPSEWGQVVFLHWTYLQPHNCFQSIGVPSEWGLKILEEGEWLPKDGFQSIGVPSEWGPYDLERGQAGTV